jgi:hypothetical protein
MDERAKVVSGVAVVNAAAKQNRLEAVLSRGIQ